MQIIQKKLADIVPYANNTKKHDETQIKNVAESIKKYGWIQPLVIDDNGTIVIGRSLPRPCRREAGNRRSALRSGQRPDGRRNKRAENR